MISKSQLVIKVLVVKILPHIIMGIVSLEFWCRDERALCRTESSQ